MTAIDVHDVRTFDNSPALVMPGLDVVLARHSWGGDQDCSDQSC